MLEVFKRLQHDPIYQPLWPILAELAATSTIPDVTVLNALRTKFFCAPAAASGAPIRFAPATGRESAKSYEAAVFHTGRVATRADSWHDFFNALVWLRFGKLKAALNALHCANSSTAQRGAQRDFATLLDESGVLLAYDDEDYVELLRQHQWPALLWTRRSELARHVRFFVVGHALYEKALSPYPGLTGKVLPLKVAGSFMQIEYDTAVSEVDETVAAYLRESAPSMTPKHLLALPILGVPGWADAQDESFYNDVRYFRPYSR